MKKEVKIELVADVEEFEQEIDTLQKKAEILIETLKKVHQLIDELNVEKTINTEAHWISQRSNLYVK